MNIWTSFLKQLQHTPNFRVCCAFVSRCLVVLRTMEIRPLLYRLLVVLLASGWPTLCNLGDHRKGITGFYSPVYVSYQFVSTET
jgi:hypothetical protein